MQFLPCSRGCEAPGHRSMSSIARVLIHGGLTGERGCVWYPPGQTLSLQDTQCDFSHIQPTAVLGRIMAFQLLQKPPRCCRGKGFIERRRFSGRGLARARKELALEGWCTICSYGIASHIRSRTCRSPTPSPKAEQHKTGRSV